MSQKSVLIHGIIYASEENGPIATAMTTHGEAEFLLIQYKEGGWTVYADKAADGIASSARLQEGQSVA
jgi:hypothetical protein